MSPDIKGTDRPGAADQRGAGLNPGRQHLAVRPTSMWRTIRSEWLKFWTLPSSIWTIAVTIVVMLGLSALMAWGFTFDPTSPGGPADGGGADVTMEGGEDFSLTSLGLVAISFSYSVGQIVLAVLGVMVATSEYATGQIRSTLTAVPTRLPVLVAKVVIVILVGLTLGALAVALSWLATTPILEPHGMQLDVSEEGAWRTLFGVPLYLSAIALFSLGIGFLLRHTAGAIAAVLGILLVLPIVGMIQIDWLQDLALYLPASAGERLVMGAPDDVLTEWQGFAVLCGYVVVALVLAGVLLRRRDA
ncbi:ABC transporter permease [Pseudactinotalea sp. Z1739]|uniref:ABC transporter permease n=1 Tax=Pseudactinotalea sp. Z1739 TaxID=3413028 RepID=UPI003C7C5549